MQKSPAHWGLRGAKWASLERLREPRGDMTRQRHHLFRRSTTKEERPGSRHLIAACPSPALTISIAQVEAHRDQRDQRWPLSPKRPPAAEASRPPPGHRECNVGATLAHSAWSRRVVKVVAMAVSDERRVVQMIAERGVRFCAPPAARAGAQPWLRGKSAGRACPGLSLRGGGPPESRASISHE